MSFTVAGNPAAHRRYSSIWPLGGGIWCPLSRRAPGRNLPRAAGGYLDNVSAWLLADTVKFLRRLRGVTLRWGHATGSAAGLRMGHPLRFCS